ncbi:MAG TPA: hypothetical protein GXX51_12315 [Firmicutes bacterium]|nr:hypothetical protein [Bacillota bacterium]
MEVEVTELVERVARLEERMNDQEEYRRRQNGAIEKLANQYESQRSWLIGLLTVGIMNLAMLLVQMAGK